jgi:hypothetical protein
MAFQSSVNIFSAFGVVGDVVYTGPIRALPYVLDSSPELNTIGRAFTVVDGADPDPSNNSSIPGQAIVGGTGVFAGILINSKEYAGFGTTGNPLAPSIDLPDESIGSLLQMGEVVVTLPAAANIGDLVLYNTTTGVLSSVAPSSTFTGVVASNTLTVSGFVAGGAPLGIGSVISGTGVVGGTVITALGTGTGGNGTYTVNGAATVASTTMKGNAIPAAGTLFVPNCVVSRFDVSGSGLAVIKLTN